MTLRERADAALARARAAAVVMPADTAHQGRLRAAMIRDVAALLGVPPEYIVVTDDATRSYGGMPGQLITVHDPDDPTTVLRFIPEPGNTGYGGGTYLLIAPCPGCNSEAEDDHQALVGDVPIASVAILADLSRALTVRRGAGGLDPEQVPVEFFDDPGHALDCPLR